MADQPGGTYTFVFTDIEGSTSMLRALGDDYARVLDEHDSIVRTAATDHGGRAFGSEGDAQNLVFNDAASAIRAAVDAQRGLAAHEWPEGHPVRVRMGIHSGEARGQGDDFVGMALHETARIASAGHGGQVLVSPATRELALNSLVDGVTLRDLGEHDLKDVPEPVRIYQLTIEGLRNEFPALRVAGAARLDLPTQLTSFVGRKEVDAVAGLLDGSRMVTLTGPGGTGKTRLSIRVASEAADRFADGTFFVALDAVSDAGLVMSEVASALSLAAATDTPLDRVIAHLATRNTLIVLDNLEQVVDAAPDVARLLKECPEVSIIATSRIPLRIHGEQEFPVPTLSFPGPDQFVDAETASDFEAVRLFTERATAVRPDYSLDDTTVPIVIDIVRRLDGLPLAIELAAARLRMLSVADLRTRLEKGLAVLSSGGRDVPERQRTLRAAIEWSHDLLDEPDQRLFSRFSVMSGGAAFAQTESICGSIDELGRDVFEGLESLSDQSLVGLTEGVEGESRFGMLMTIREYATEQLVRSGEAEALRERHARVFMELAEEAAAHLTAADGASWNDRLEVEHDNLRAAIDWAVASEQAEIALRIATAMWRFWQVRGHLVEATERLDRVLAMPSVEDQPAALRARAEGAAGSVAYWRSSRKAMHQHYAAALLHARAADDEPILAEALYNMSFTPTDRDVPLSEQHAESRPFLDEALEIYRRLDDRPGIASALWAIAQMIGNLGDDEEFERIAQESLELSRELGDPFRMGWAAFILAFHRMERKDAVGILAPLQESLDIFAGSGDAGGIVLSLQLVAFNGIVSGDPDGLRLWGAINRLATETGTDRWDGDPRYDRFKPNPQSDEELAAFEDGQRLDREEAIELGRAILERARAALDAPGPTPR